MRHNKLKPYGVRYPSIITKAGKNQLTELPTCPGCQTFAPPDRAVRREAKEALELWLETHLQERMLPPRPPRIFKARKPRFEPDDRDAKPDRDGRADRFTSLDLRINEALRETAAKAGTWSCPSARSRRTARPLERPGRDCPPEADVHAPLERVKCEHRQPDCEPPRPSRFEPSCNFDCV